jgi:DNA mismatch repair protein MutS
VAKLAGLPPAVIARAQEVLRALEAGQGGRKVTSIVDDLPLFSIAAKSTEKSQAVDKEIEPLIDALNAINPDELTPKEALEFVYRLRSLINR